MVSEATLKEITRRLVDKFHPEAVILFGSQARGTADDRSDVDLLVLYRLRPDQDRSAIWLDMERSLWGLRVGRDIVVMTPGEYAQHRNLPGGVAGYAANEGRVLYAAA
jgi:predicted nucleotidyltransferase